MPKAPTSKVTKAPIPIYAACMEELDKLKKERIGWVTQNKEVWRDNAKLFKQVEEVEKANADLVQQLSLASSREVAMAEKLKHAEWAREQSLKQIGLIDAALQEARMSLTAVVKAFAHG